MFYYEYYESFKNAYFGEHLGTDAFFTFFEYRIEIFFVISEKTNFSIPKTPTMNLEKMLKIIYQNRSYFISFCSVS